MPHRHPRTIVGCRSPLLIVLLLASCPAVFIHSALAQDQLTAGPNPSEQAAPPELEELQATIAESLPATLSLLQASAAVYVEERECFSCHQQALPPMPRALATQRGWKIDTDQAQAQAQFTHDYFEPRQARLRQGTGVIGGSYTAGYALTSLAAADWPCDDTTAALVTYLLEVQEKDGSWKIRTRRPPLEASDFTATALAVRGFAAYAKAPEEKRADAEQAPAEEADDESSRTTAEATQGDEDGTVEAIDPGKAAAAIGQARRWLQNAKPRSNEDRIFHLLGLNWSGAAEDEIAASRQQLLEAQRPDGGWEQEPGLGSDAYATGQALVALHEAGGLPVDHLVYRRGLQFLIETRQADGTWRIATRSKPIQVYFESGFPHGPSQFISISGTAWAAMALLHAAAEVESAPH